MWAAGSSAPQDSERVATPVRFRTWLLSPSLGSGIRQQWAEVIGADRLGISTRLNESRLGPHHFFMSSMLYVPVAKDQELYALAESQHGYFTSAQAKAAGLLQNTLTHMARRGP